MSKQGGREREGRERDALGGMNGAADDSLDTHAHVTQVTQARAIIHTNKTGEIAERPTATDNYLYVAVICHGIITPHAHSQLRRQCCKKIYWCVDTVY